MGVFDYIRCEYPIAAPPELEFQTKDTDEQYLEEYKIDVNGHLLLHKKERVWEQDPSHILGGYCKVTSSEWVQIKDFRGEINFYAGDSKVWWEYSALFKDGELIDMKPICEGKPYD